MKNEMKTNNKTVLLAIVAVFAMIAAGAAVVAVSSDTDAVDTSYAATALPEATEISASAYEIEAAGIFFVSAASSTISLNTGAGDDVVTVFVKTGSTVTFEGKAANTSVVTVSTYFLDGTAKKYLLGNETGADTNITLTALVANDSITVTPTIGAAGDASKDSTMVIGGSIVTGAFDAAKGCLNVTKDDAPHFTVSASDFAYKAAVAAISAKTITQKGTVFTFSSTMQKSYTFDAADAGTFTIYKLAGAYSGKITYTYGDKRTVFTFDNLLVAADKPFVLTIVAATAPAIAGDADATNKGTISVYSGLATRAAGAFAGELNAISNAAGTSLSAQLLITTEPAVVYNTVNGNVIQTASISLTGSALAVPYGNTLVIPEGVTVEVKAATEIAGEVDIFGNLVTDGTVPGRFIGAGAAAIAVGKIGPSAFTDFIATGDYAVLQNMADDGTQTELGGEIKQNTSMGDIIVKAGGLTINEGSILTVNGDLGLNGQKLTVKGQLVVNGRVYSTGTAEPAVTNNADVIVLATTGSISVSGDFALNTIVGLALGDESIDVKLVGVNGLEYGFTTVDNNKVATIDGELTANTKAYERILPGVKAAENVIVSEGLAIGTGVYVLISNDKTMTVAGGAILSVGKNGFLLGNDDEKIIIANDGVAVFNGIVQDADVWAYYGVVTKEDPTPAPAKAIAFSVDYVAATLTTPEYYQFVSGLVVSAAQDKVGTVTTQRIYIGGEVSLVKVEDALPAGVDDDGSNKITLTGKFVTDDDIGLTLGGTTQYTDYTAAAEILIAGEAQAAEANKFGNIYVGGHYITVVEEINIHHYMLLEDAIDDIELAENKKVDSTVEEIDFDITILDGETLNLVVAADIKSTATVTVEANGIISGAFDVVYGVLYQTYGGKVTAPAVYAAKTTTAAGDNIYAGLIPAIALATAGSIVTVTDGTADGNLVISNEVTVVVTDQIVITGDLTIDEDSALVGGIIKFDDQKATTATKHTITINGLMDVTDGSIKCEGTDTVVATVAGALAVVNENVISGATSYFAEALNGAVYADDDGVVLTTIDQAILGAVLAEADDIVIFGTVSYPGDLIIAEVTVKFKDATSKLVLGDVALTDAVIDIANGAFTGNVIVSESEVDFNAVKGTLKITGDSKKETLTLNGDVTEGYVVADTGNVILNGVNFNGAGANNTVFVVNADADVDVITAATAVAGAKAVLTVYGIVDVFNGGTLNLTSGSICNAGVMTAFKDTTAGTINIGSLVNLGSLVNIDGTINVAANSAKDANGAITGLVVGEEMFGLGADNGTVIGNLIFTNGATQFLVFVGADVDEMTINAAGGVDAGKFTAFYINGAPYMYIYGTGAAIQAPILNVPTYDIPGYVKPTGEAALNTLAGWGLTAAAQVGTPAMAETDIVKSRAAFIVSPITGLSLVIDNITYKDTTANVMLTVGTHTVTYTMNPGYKMADGTTATIAMNGKTVTGQITVTPDMVGGENAITASGTVVVDQPDIPEQEKEDNTIITVLLAVLVVMVVILAIVVILRMMRS